MKKYLTEFIGTFFLVLTVGCTVIPNAAGMIAPLAIGAVLTGMVLGATIMKLVQLSDIWIHIAADLTGGLVAALAFRFLNPEDA